ncbi:TonB-dependent receptor, partial [Candidatus Poribacteria bacterium]|nr:TonB-dependent receptor [Candidatus Poribacteria bacterium]
DVVYFDASDGNWLGSEFQFWWDVRSNNRLTVGAGYQNHLRADYRAWNSETTDFNRNFPFRVLSLYLQDEYQVMENLSLTFGIRQDKYSTVGGAITPRSAIVYNPIKSGTLKLLYGEAFRAPNVFEVNYEDALAGYKPNPSLNPEKVRTTELIWEQRLGDKLFGIVSLYHYDMKNLIDPITDSSDSLTQFQNVSQVKANGLELELNSRTVCGRRCP